MLTVGQLGKNPPLLLAELWAWLWDVKYQSLEIFSVTDIGWVWKAAFRMEEAQVEF